MPMKTNFRHLSGDGRGNPIACNRTSSNINLRAREPIGRSFGLVRGKFPSRKAGRMIHWESQLERDAVLQFEFSTGVVMYREQPFSIHYTIDGRTRRYTPDFEILRTDGEFIVVEVKPVEKFQDPDIKRKFDHIQMHFDRHGQQFRILTEKNIRRTDLLENLRIRMRHRRMPLSRYQRRQFAEMLIGVHSISFKDAAALFGDFTIVWVLIDERLLFCDMSKRINSQTIFFTISIGGSDEILFF